MGPPPAAAPPTPRPAAPAPPAERAPPAPALHPSDGPGGNPEPVRPSPAVSANSLSPVHPPLPMVRHGVGCVPSPLDFFRRSGGFAKSAPRCFRLANARRNGTVSLGEDAADSQTSIAPPYSCDDCCGNSVVPRCSQLRDTMTRQVARDCSARRRVQRSVGLEGRADRCFRSSPRGCGGLGFVPPATGVGRPLDEFACLRGEFVLMPFALRAATRLDVR